jgi:hypothetical protein
MDSLPEKPLVCPLCQEDWILSEYTDLGELTENRSHKYYICANHFTCQVFYIEKEDDDNCFYLKKTLTNGVAVWWEHNQYAEIKRTNCYKYEILNFIPPFTIDLSRLKKLMVFS